MLFQAPSIAAEPRSAPSGYCRKLRHGRQWQLRRATRAPEIRTLDHASWGVCGCGESLSVRFRGIRGARGRLVYPPPCTERARWRVGTLLWGHVLLGCPSGGVGGFQEARLLIGNTACASRDLSMALAPRLVEGPFREKKMRTEKTVSPQSDPKSFPCSQGESLAKNVVLRKG